MDDCRMDLEPQLSHDLSVSSRYSRSPSRLLAVLGPRHSASRQALASRHAFMAFAFATRSWLRGSASWASAMKLRLRHQCLPGALTQLSARYSKVSRSRHAVLL